MGEEIYPQSGIYIYKKKIYWLCVATAFAFFVVATFFGLKWWETRTRLLVQAYRVGELENQVQILENQILQSQKQKGQVITEQGSTFKDCFQDLYSDNIGLYMFLEGKLSEFFPDFEVYGVGSFCELSDGSRLVSFSHYTGDPSLPNSKPGQTVVLFDQNNNKLKATEGFYCRTLGDLGYPVFDSIKDNIVQMSCRSGDGPIQRIEIYQLDLGSFSFKLVEEMGD